MSENGSKRFKNISANNYWSNTAKQLFAGGLSGCFEASCTYPTDFVKISLQLDERTGQERKFKNSFDVVRKTWHSYGFFGLYRGFSVVFYGSVPKYMFRFGSYEQIKPFLVNEKGQLSGYNKMLCGLGAGISEALFAVIPQESIKVKFINDRFSDKPKYNGLIHGIREIIREKGWRGTYQGVLSTLLKQGSNQAIRFFVFESLNERFQSSHRDSPHATNDSSLQRKALIPIFGAIAGAVSVIANTPIDVLKTRMQSIEADRYDGNLDCIKKIYQNEGFKGFYKGLTPRLVKVSLEVAIAFTVYKTILELIKIK
ncbi:SH3 domain-binding protein 5 [Sarcoptes scabiei]|nr:SH3 domain-binding protein 5 [Sarcoptes scabiei]